VSTGGRGSPGGGCIARVRSGAAEAVQGRVIANATATREKTVLDRFASNMLESFLWTGDGC